jgi:hypothetical protein
MGFWSWLKGGYNWLKTNIVQPVWGGVKKVHGFLSGGWHKLDNWLKNASTSGIPIVSEIAGLIHGNPLYGTIDSIVSESDNIVNYGENIGSTLEGIFGSESAPDAEKLKEQAQDIYKMINATGGRLSNLGRQAVGQIGDIAKGGVGIVMPNAPIQVGGGTMTPSIPSAPSAPVQGRTIQIGAS